MAIEILDREYPTRDLSGNAFQRLTAAADQATRAAQEEERRADEATKRAKEAKRKRHEAMMAIHAGGVMATLARSGALDSPRTRARRAEAGAAASATSGDGGGIATATTTAAAAATAAAVWGKKRLLGVAKRLVGGGGSAQGSGNQATRSRSGGGAQDDNWRWATGPVTGDWRGEGEILVPDKHDGEEGAGVFGVPSIMKLPKAVREAMQKAVTQTPTVADFLLGSTASVRQGKGGGGGVGVGGGGGGLVGAVCSLYLCLNVCLVLDCPTRMLQRASRLRPPFVGRCMGLLDASSPLGEATCKNGRPKVSETAPPPPPPPSPVFLFPLLWLRRVNGVHGSMARAVFLLHRF